MDRNLIAPVVQSHYSGRCRFSVRPDQSENRENPQGNQRVRGIGPATNTRDYFITDIPFDSYNTSRVTISRGPNSLLFGIGNPAGIIEASTSRPLLNRNRTEIGTRFGSEESYRATLDLNRVLEKDRIAFRIASVNEQNNYQQKPAFDRKRRIYGAHAVKHLWFVDPVVRLLEVFALRGAEWVLVDTFVDETSVCAPPFEAISFPLAALWPLDPAPEQA